MAASRGAGLMEVFHLRLWFIAFVQLSGNVDSALEPAALAADVQNPDTNGRDSPATSVRICDPSSLPLVQCPLKEHGFDWTIFLELACRYCQFGLPCELQPTSDPLVAKMQAVFESQLSYHCIPGLLAALIVSAQFFLVKADILPEVAALMNVNKSLAPFPFYTLQYSLFANMVPARLMLCDKTLWHKMTNKYVPRVHPEDSGRCGMVYNDEVLVYKCRSRRYDRTADRSALLQGIRCPNTEAIDLDPDLARRLQKYGQRAQAPADQCQSSRGMWREAMSDVHKCILITVAHLLDFRPGQLALDWGSGCGHKLTWAKSLFDVDGVGLDVEGGAVAWARHHSAGVFCHADGRRLDWLPKGTFDHVISYAALYHLSKVDQCHTGIQLISKLRAGGKAFFGWNQAYSMDAWDWRACLLNTSLWGDLPPDDLALMSSMQIDFQAIEDGFLFPPRTSVAEKHYLYQYPAFSLLLTRLA